MSDYSDPDDPLPHAPPPGPVLTRAQVREVDRLAIEELGIPGIVLMENAARHVADVVLSILEDELRIVTPDARVAVLCGGGHNGGDGYAVARLLHNAGVNVAVFAAGDPTALQGDAALNHAIVRKMGLEVRAILTEQEGAAESESWPDMHVIVDALLGTGFEGPVREPMRGLIEACNQAREQGAKVVSVDVPSGLDCDTGRPADATVRAEVTVTFVAAKRGLLAPTAQPFVGQLHVADIGAPPWLIERALRER